MYIVSDISVNFVIFVSAASDVKLERSLLTEQGLPVLTLSNGRTCTYQPELGCW